MKISRAPLLMVRWSLISMDEFIDVVEPSNVLDAPQLMAIMKRNRENSTHRIPCSSAEFSGENFASAKYNAETISGENASALLSGNFTNYDLKEGFTYHPIPDEIYNTYISSHKKHLKYISIIVKLGKIHIINYIEMLLMDKDKRSFSYCIDVSGDGVRYKRLIDCTAHYSRSWQFLHFPSCPVRFIQLIGTRAMNVKPTNFNSVTYTNNSKGGFHPKFEVVGFKAMYIEGQDTANWSVKGFLRPTKNVADLKIGAIVLKGGGDNSMLNENMDEFTCHLRNDHILLQLNQPYYISSMRMLLGCDKNHSNQYSFYIETSLDHKEWQMSVDKREESLSGWQQFEFEERPVVFIKIVGTQPDIDFVCTYFECPSSARKPTLHQSQST